MGPSSQKQDTAGRSDLKRSDAAPSRDERSDAAPDRAQSPGSPQSTADESAGSALSAAVRGPGSVGRVALLAGCVASAGLVTLVVLAAAGALTPQPLPGLGDPGPVTPWGLPLARVLTRIAAAATVGLLIAAAFFAPGLASGDRRESGRTVGPAGYRWLRAASWAAAVWLLTGVAQLVFTMSDLLGVRPSAALSPAAIGLAGGLDVIQALLATLVGAAVIAVAARLVLSVTGAALLAVLAVIAVLPPAFTGHAAAAGNHQLAVDSMLWHIAGSAIWAGGLLALLLTRWAWGAAGSAPGALAYPVRRYSRAATWCFVIVAVSGFVNTFGQIELSDVLTTGYGRIAAAKATALVLLGAAGLWQRRANLAALDAGRAGAFRRFAIAELLLFAGTFGLAVALSATPAPVTVADESSATALLGYPPPDGLPTGRGILFDWQLDPLFLGAALIAALLYVIGVWRLWRSGVEWSWLRAASWCGGWLVFAFATNSGLATYAPLMFSIHMGQHLALMTAAPVLMVLGAPITLALRALRPARQPGMRGPREWLRLALNSRVAKVLGHPATALAVLSASLFGMYFTDLYQLALRSHLAHLAMLVHLTLAGYLFFWTVIGLDPTPHRVAPPVRLLVLFAGMGFHAFFGVALMQSGVPIAPDWYHALDLGWLPDPLADQKTAGGIAWSFGEIPSLVVAIALVVQWIRADEREQRRFDRAEQRAADSGDPSLDPHQAYNEYLARLAEADRKAPPG